MIRETNGIAGQVLRNFGLNLKSTRDEIVKLISAQPPKAEEDSSLPTLSVYTQTALRVFRDGVLTAEARTMDQPVGTGHILLALIQEKDSIAAAILQKAGLTLETLHEEISNLKEPWAKTIKPYHKMT
jgi:ATP-dependent Clp protease ATP-binding subunit ClpA